MPGALRWFAANQPFTPIIETLRGLLTGTAIGSDRAVAGAWCVAIATGGFLWSRSLFDRDPVRWDGPGPRPVPAFSGGPQAPTWALAQR